MVVQAYSNLGVVTTTSFLTPTQLGTISETVKIRRRAYATYNSVLCDEQVTAPIDITLDTERTPEIRRNGVQITTLTVCASQDIILSAEGALAGTDTYTWYINASEQASGTVNYTILSDGTLTLEEKQ